MNASIRRHRRSWMLLLLCSCWTAWATPSLAAAPTSEAQTLLPSRPIEIPSLMLPVEAADFDQRRRDLALWVDQFAAWKKWHDEWRNRAEPGWFRARERRPRPEPPSWLFDQCPTLIQADSLFDDACRLLVEWNEDAAAEVLRQTNATQQPPEAPPTKTLWWEHVHLDMLWVMPQPGVRVYGVVGVHATMEIGRRFEMFIAPGAILMNLPSAKGGREWTAATDWGIAFRVFDFQVPGTHQRATLHANLAKAWVLANPTVLGKRSVDLMGLSVSLKRH
jgi:hypothetical protein